MALQFQLVLRLVLGFAALFSLAATHAQQSYPTRPIRLVVPSAPGGGTDIAARIIAPKLSEFLGQTVVIENCPGAGTMIGGEVAARATPDGYTLLMGISTLAINPAVYKKVPYDALKDFAPITQVVSVPNILVTHHRPLVHRVVRDPVPGTMTASSGVTNDLASHRWEFRNVPRMYEEPNLPEQHMVVQRLLVSTIPDWATISRWYWGLSEPRLKAVTPEMKDAARGLVAGATNDLQKVEKVFAFVSQKIRYMGIIAEDEAPGFEPHDVSITFSNRYGVCRDKAAVLVALLREAGLPSFPVLIHAGQQTTQCDEGADGHYLFFRHV